MIVKTGLAFDNAHNEFLHLLITVGAFGLAGYLLLAFGALRAAWKAGRNSAVFCAVFMALISHLAQSAFNIAQPETTPAVFLLLGVAAAAAGRKTAEASGR